MNTLNILQWAQGSVTTATGFSSAGSAVAGLVVVRLHLNSIKWTVMALMLSASNSTNPYQSTDTFVYSAPLVAVFRQPTGGAVVELSDLGSEGLTLAQRVERSDHGSEGSVSESIRFRELWFRGSLMCGLLTRGSANSDSLQYSASLKFGIIGLSSFRDGLRESVSHLPILTDSIILILVLSSLAEDGYHYGNPPREALHPSRWAFDETRAKVRQSNPHSPSPSRSSRQNRDHGYSRLANSISLKDAFDLMLLDRAHICTNLWRLRDRRRQLLYNDSNPNRVLLAMFYDEEREMEPRNELTTELPLTIFFEKQYLFPQKEFIKGRRRPLEEAPRNWTVQRVNLPHFCSTLGSGENGLPLLIFSNLRLRQKAGSILDYEDLKEKFRSYFSQQKKFTKTHLAVHNIKQREGGSTRAFITRYTDDTLQILGLHEEQRISGFVHGLRTRSLVEHLSTDLPSTYKGLMEKTYTWVKAREVATNGASSDRRDSFDFERSKKFSWGISIGQKDRGRFSPYKGQNHKLLSNLVKSPREILATEKVAKTFEQPPRFPGANWSKDKTRYCHFYEDYGHQTNQWVKEKKEKTIGTRSEEIKKEEKKPTLDKVSVLMISGKNCNVKKRPANHGRIGEITFPPLPNVGSSDPVIIKVYISGRQVNRAYLDGGSSCEVKYEHCFLKLKPSIRSLQVDSNTPLVGFSGEQSWPLGEIPLEVTIGEGPITVTKTLTFVIVKSDSPHNLLLGRTAMQQMGIVVSTVHGAIKFHTPRDKVFGHQMERNMEVNADDMVIKSDSEEEMMADNTETLERLRAINLKLNPKKCSFGAEEGIYSGHLITKQGIRADPLVTDIH
ncbi:reverse transcriptase domain-containing protein [Tanacetum coccineum]